MSVQTSNLESARIVVEWHPTVKAADIVDRHDGERVLELVFLEGVDRVPPGVLRMLAEKDCGIGPVQPQSDHLVAEVR